MARMQVPAGEIRAALLAVLACGPRSIKDIKTVMVGKLGYSASWTNSLTDLKAEGYVAEIDRGPLQGFYVQMRNAKGESVKQ